ncbi:MAG: DNA cytosine methyltransferase [Bacteroidota bacterium]
MKILNLYACLGGNRYKWDQVTDVEVTAVELDPVAAKLYQERFPNDKVVVGDAHEYLLNHYKEFDFIWSSPPCPTHSRVPYSQKNTESYVPRYADMKLYQEIIFLKTHFDGLYCVENVIPYYKALIPADIRGRHLYWANFSLPVSLSNRKPEIGMCSGKRKFVPEREIIEALCKFHDYDFFKYDGKQRRIKMARNLVDYQAGKSILRAAIKALVSKNAKQLELI